MPFGGPSLRVCFMQRRVAGLRPHGRRSIVKSSGEWRDKGKADPSRQESDSQSSLVTAIRYDVCAAYRVPVRIAALESAAPPTEARGLPPLTRRQRQDGEVNSPLQTLTGAAPP